jgi:hypothetical protein
MRQNGCLIVEILRVQERKVGFAQEATAVLHSARIHVPMQSFHGGEVVWRPRESNCSLMVGFS